MSSLAFGKASRSSRWASSISWAWQAAAEMSSVRTVKSAAERRRAVVSEVMGKLCVSVTGCRRRNPQSPGGWTGEGSPLAARRLRALDLRHGGNRRIRNAAGEVEAAHDDPLL